VNVCIVITVAIVMLLRDFGSYWIIIVNVCIVITVSMVMLFRDFRSYWIIIVNVCIFITVAMVMLFRDFGPHGIILMTTCSLIHGLLCTCTSTQRSTDIIPSKFKCRPPKVNATIQNSDRIL
jgi:hypothetical protein